MQTTNRTSRRVRAITAGVALAMLTGQGLALAGEHDDPDSDVKTVSAEQARRTDAEIVAKTKGWTVQQALDRGQLQDVLGDIADTAARRHPKTFTSAILPDEPGQPAVMRFVGEVPADVAKAVEAARIDVKFDTTARFSDAELNERSEKIRDVLAEQGFRDVVTAISPEGNVEVQTVAKEGTPKLPRSLRENTKLSQVDGAQGVLEHDRGGALVTDASSGSWCTSGWSVRNVSTGELGVTTAGHCSGIDTFTEPVLGFTFDLEHESQHIGNYGDIEWKTSPSHVTRAEFWARDTELREVHSIESWWGFLFGGTYCVYGRTTDLRACDDLYRRNVSANFGFANDTKKMHAMENDNTLGGDSGGGWSFNNEAAGGHIGDLTINGQSRNVFSQARLFDEAIGVEVLTQ